MQIHLKSLASQLAPRGVFGAALTVLLAGCAIEPGTGDFAQEGSALTVATRFADGTGQINTVATTPTGTVDTTNPFFQSLGTNGRSCNSCHKAEAAWTITPPQIQALFNATQGLDPLFRTNDGSNSPTAPVGTLAQRRAAYSLLLSRGLIRIELPLPATRDYDVTVDPGRNPYGVGLLNNNISVYRRPLPSANLKFLATVMWDGREATGATVRDRLLVQANDATRGHAQGARDLTDAERAAIVDLQLQMFVAQETDTGAGNLGQNGANGGAAVLSTQPFFLGINDPLGGNPTGAAFTPAIFNLFDAWASLTGSSVAARRASIARGQKIFNTRPIAISGVRGVNDVLGVATLNGNCGTCHDAPNAGDHSLALPLDLGVTDISQNGDNALPVFFVKSRATGQVVTTTDPGRALINGKFSSTATFKGPILRGLSARAPYFHNGSASNLAAVVKFYDTRFHLGFQAQELTDLQAFLESL
jgi:cytochrome c peroxidase